MDIILASASPRRQELLKLIYKDFQIVPAQIDERADVDNVEKAPEKIAEKKALSIAQSYPESLVIGCDTAVIVDDIILGKPKDKEEAEKMLRLLSGRKHKVITGCCLCLNGKIRSFSQVTLVEFYLLSNEEIEEYLNTPEEQSTAQYQWQDKAGGYGIQSRAGLFVKGIDGDYNNVVGLPCSRLYREIKDFL